MRHRRLVLIACVSLGTLVAGVRPARAQSARPPEAPATEGQQVRDELSRLKSEMDRLKKDLEVLEQRLAILSGPNVTEIASIPAVAPPPDAAVSPPPAAGVPQPAAPAPQQNMAGASKAFNPDASVIANFIGVAGKNPMSNQPPLELSEAEMSFQAVVDPYARADFFLSAGPTGLNIEEGYVTFNTLPGGLLLKVGKMRAQFGKVNTMHSHVLPWVDRPLVTKNLVGGEDGIADSGLSLSRLVPNGFMFLEATGEVYQGDSNVFKSDRRSRLAYVGRLRGFRDLTEGSNIDLGGSFAFGPANLASAPTQVAPPAPQDDLDRRLIGFDATFRYRPLRRAIYRRFQARTEFIWSRQNLATGAAVKAFGFYGSGEYQFARRWFVGARVDQSRRPFEPTLKDKAGSLFLTYWPSEFSQIRGQFRHTTFAGGVKANEFLFQFNFAIGAHGAHVF